MSKEIIDIIHIIYELIYISFLLVALYVVCMVIIGKIKVDIKITTRKEK
jgi:hypothetical protein